MPDNQPFFSIIIPTRNRVALFCEALDSVVAQDFPSKEIVVVNDGSTGEVLESYKALESRYPEVKFNYLVHRPNGHGQSYSMNYGAGCASGLYLCFLDDDDYWTDSEHLSRAHKSLSSREKVVDAYYTNQDAFLSSGERVTPNPWIADLQSHVSGLVKDAQGTSAMSPALLFESRGFAHLNCSIYRREFYLSIGGMDENIRYECDRDIFIRAVDSAEVILYNPAVISFHRVPDPKKADNMSTAVSVYQKRLYQLGVYEKGCLLSRRESVRRHCIEGKGYQLKHIVESLTDEDRNRLALRYAAQALGAQPGLKWTFVVVKLIFKALFSIK